MTSDMPYPRFSHILSLRHAPARLLLLAGVSAGLVACGGDAAQDTSDPAAHGRNMFLVHCSACHQREGGGLPGAFPPLAGADWLREQSTEQAIAVVLRGLSGPLTVNGQSYNAVMPPMSHLSDRDIAAILTHVYANWGNDGRVVSAEMVAAVRAGQPLPAE
jgi:mono/diheme cytochrome c family protein